MPSSELSRIRLWSWAHFVCRLESLLLSILNGCSQTLDKFGTKLVQVANFYTLYTSYTNLLNQLSIFIQKQITVCAPIFRVYTTGFFELSRCYQATSTHHPQPLLRQLNKGLY